MFSFWQVLSNPLEKQSCSFVTALGRALRTCPRQGIRSDCEYIIRLCSIGTVRVEAGGCKATVPREPHLKHPADRSVTLVPQALLQPRHWGIVR